jgi:hypothetical protein
VIIAVLIAAAAMLGVSPPFGSVHARSDNWQRSDKVANAASPPIQQMNH